MTTDPLPPQLSAAPDGSRLVLWVVTFLLLGLALAVSARGGVEVSPGPVPAGSGAGAGVGAFAESSCVPDGSVVRCTHASTRAAANAGPAVFPGCAGDGVSGNRVQVVYVKVVGRADRFGRVAGRIRHEVAVANGVFTRSSDGARALRVVTSSSCVVAVERATVTRGQARSFASLTAALRASGRDRVDRKYLVFLDERRGCGTGEYYADDSPGASNLNNDGNLFAVVHVPCWKGTLVAHELVHTMGGVQESAPRATGGYGHCFDGHEVMCYADGYGRAVSERCPQSHASLLDCGRDDYFSVSPQRGSYLASHWNVASSSFLVGGGAPREAPPSVPVNVNAVRSGDVVTLSWGTPRQARSGIAGFDVVDRATWTIVGSVSGSERTARVTLQPWREYRLGVLARNAHGSSPVAGDLPHLVGRAPASPSAPLVTATPSGTTSGSGVYPVVSWAAVKHATSYVVARNGVDVATVTGSRWDDPSPLGLLEERSYTVRAVNAWGSSAPSAPGRVVGGSPPDLPQDMPQD